MPHSGTFVRKRLRRSDYSSDLLFVWMMWCVVRVHPSLRTVDFGLQLLKRYFAEQRAPTTSALAAGFFASAKQTLEADGF